MYDIDLSSAYFLEDGNLTGLNSDFAAQGLLRRVLEEFVDKAECAKISAALNDAQEALEWCARSTVQSTVTGGNGEFLHPILQEVEERAAALVAAQFGAHVVTHLSSIAHTKDTEMVSFGLHADQCNIERASPGGECDGLNPYFAQPELQISLLLRAFTVVVYFSDVPEHSGGEFVFAAPFAKMGAPATHVIRPRCGRAVAFKSDHASPHGVNRGSFRGPMQERIAFQIWMKNATQHVVHGRFGTLDAKATLQANLHAAELAQLPDAEAESIVARFPDVDWAIMHALQMRRHPDIWPMEGKIAIDKIGGISSDLSGKHELDRFEL